MTDQTTNPNTELSEEVLKRFNEKFTYGGITGTVALDPSKFEHGLDDPRPFKQFLAEELTQQAREILDAVDKEVVGEDEPPIIDMRQPYQGGKGYQGAKAQNTLRKVQRTKLATLRDTYGVKEEK